MQEMRCQSQYTLCSSDSDCPTGWSCYSPAGGPALPPDAGAQAAPKACYPPFAMFNGPAGGGGGLAGPGGPCAFTDAGTGSDAASDASSPPGGSGGGGCAVASSRTAAPSPWLIAGAIAAIARRRRAR
jgi:hypothetical protein